ncbi:MAG: hypothetical protein QW453_05450 [Thermoprotei archaeon]
MPKGGKDINADMGEVEAGGEGEGVEGEAGGERKFVCPSCGSELDYVIDVGGGWSRCPLCNASLRPKSVPIWVERKRGEKGEGGEKGFGLEGPRTPAQIVAEVLDLWDCPEKFKNFVVKRIETLGAVSASELSTLLLTSVGSPWKGNNGTVAMIVNDFARLVQQEEMKRARMQAEPAFYPPVTTHSEPGYGLPAGGDVYAAPPMYGVPPQGRGFSYGAVAQQPSQPDRLKELEEKWQKRFEEQERKHREEIEEINRRQKEEEEKRRIEERFAKHEEMLEQLRNAVMGLKGEFENGITQLKAEIRGTASEKQKESLEAVLENQRKMYEEKISALTEQLQALQGAIADERIKKIEREAQEAKQLAMRTPPSNVPGEAIVTQGMSTIERVLNDRKPMKEIVGIAKEVFAQPTQAQPEANLADQLPEDIKE